MSRLALLALAFATPAFAEEVNIYSHRQPELIQPLMDAFTAETGIEVVYDLYASLASTSLGRALPGLIVEMSTDPELAAAVEELWTSRQAEVAKVIRRGIATGQARADLDVRVTLELLAASPYYRLLITGATLDRRSARRHADALVAFTRLQ